MASGKEEVWLEKTISDMRGGQSVEMGFLPLRGRTRRGQDAVFDVGTPDQWRRVLPEAGCGRHRLRCPGSETDLRGSSQYPKG
jgi:hypothetical protein